MVSPSILQRPCCCKSLVTIDIQGDGICASQSFTQTTQTSFSFIPGDPVAAVTRLLSQLHRTTRFDDTAFVFGTRSDPLHPFSDRFPVAMKIMSLLASISPAYLLVQTRSPMVLLLMPMIKALGQRAAVTIALETVNDQCSAELFENLPRPSERIFVARTLKKESVNTIIQCAPLPTSIENDSDRRTLAKVASQIGDAVRVVDLREAVDQCVLYDKKLAIVTRTFDIAPNESLQASAKLSEQLAQISPEKLCKDVFSSDENEELAA